MKNQRYIEAKTRGFTLVELSIVVVIVGLLIAGISAGQSMIKQAKLTSVINELTQIHTAINSFKARFGYYPGDFPNAFAYWGQDCGANEAACNGNGDGVIAWVDGFCPDNQEPLNMWVHLQLAELIDGKFTGKCNVAGWGWDASGTHVSKLGGYATWQMASFPTNFYQFTASPYQNTTLNVLVLSGGGAGPANAWSPVLNPMDAKSIDTKIDDGLPSSGFFISGVGSGTVGTCSSLVNNTYNISEEEPNCIIGYTGVN